MSRSITHIGTLVIPWIHITSFAGLMLHTLSCSHNLHCWCLRRDCLEDLRETAKADQDQISNYNNGRNEIKHCHLIQELFIPIVEQCRYLKTTISIKISDLDLKRLMRKMYANANLLSRKFSKFSINAKCNLFNTYCSNLYCAPMYCIVFYCIMRPPIPKAD